MFDLLKKKNELKYQKRCLESINYLLNPDTIQRYRDVQGIIKYHIMRNILEIENDVFSNPLYEIKKHYEHNLEVNKKRLVSATGADREEIMGIISSDELFLRNLTNDYINKYVDILNNIANVNKLRKYVENDELLDKYDLIYNNNELDNKKVK